MSADLLSPGEAGDRLAPVMLAWQLDALGRAEWAGNAALLSGWSMDDVLEYALEVYAEAARREVLRQAGVAA